MDIRISGHQVDTGEALQKHVSSRLESIAEKFFSRTISAQVTFGLAPHSGFRCDIVCHVTAGLILKGAGGDIMLKCLERVMDGEQWLDRDAMHQIVDQLGKPVERPLELTRRETEVARLVSFGSRNKEIARELDISEGTVKMHLHNLYEKLKVTSRTELAILVRDKGLS